MVIKTEHGYELETSDIDGAIHAACGTTLKQSWYFSIDTWYKEPFMFCRKCKVAIPILDDSYLHHISGSSIHNTV
jgi:hypothetical protein